MVRHFWVLPESDVATLSHHLEFIAAMLDNTMDHMDDLAAGAYVMDASARELRRSLVFGQECLGQVHRLLSVAIVMPLDVDFAGPTYVSERSSLLHPQVSRALSQRQRPLGGQLRQTMVPSRVSLSRLLMHQHHPRNDLFPKKVVSRLSEWQANLYDCMMDTEFI